MKVMENKSAHDFTCLHCQGKLFIFLGLHQQKGLFKNHELWTCKGCHSTFASESIEVNISTESATFRKQAFPFYRRFKPS
ncbi:MAG: hypothetical protein FJ264_11240 [Planctomycetes bacterium]|nr:hypothetical protein [Planctomycetota bacterium]